MQQTNAMTLKITMLGGVCPVQAEGTIDGKRFYFRARGRSWRMEIDDRLFREGLYGTGPFDAGWMPERDAREIIEQCAKDYMEQAANMHLPKLIGITGAAGSGKTTLAHQLMTSDDYRHLPFAGPLKQMLAVLDVPARNIHGSTDDKNMPLDILGGKSARYAMQTLGTEWGRRIMGENFWVSIWSNKASRLLKSGFRVVVDDVRFPNETDAIWSLGGVVVRVQRPGVVSVRDHASERTDSLSVDFEVLNRGQEYQLREALLIGLSAWNTPPNLSIAS